MKLRLVTATVVGAAIAALGATTASPATVALRTCGTVKGGGATWTVVAAGVACTAAKPLVRKLSTKPHGLATKLGTYLGLKCIEFSGNGKREIACVSPSGGRSVYGVSKK
jgi:hypothetical protein